MQDDFRTHQIATNQWQLLKTIAADSPGTFSDETDWGGTNVAPTSGFTGLPHERRRSHEDLEIISLWVVALDGTGAVLGRGSPVMNWTIQMVQVVRYPDDLIFDTGPNRTTAPPLLSSVVIDSLGVSTGVTLNREIQLEARAMRRFTTRFSGFTNVPGTAETLLVFWRP
jgi:hypothetical protein